MQTGILPVCSLDLFDENFKHFWVDSLEGLLEKFPKLEYPHKNNFYTLLIIDQAQGEIEIDNEKVTLIDAKIIIIKPRCINSIKINNKASGKIICFSEDFFSLRYNNNILSQFAFLDREAKTSFRFAEIQRQKIDILLQLMQEEYRLQKNETTKVIRSYLNIFLFELERLYSPMGIVKNRNIKQDKIQLFEKLIEKHFVSKKLPSCYATMLNVSTNYLNKLCKEETGQTARDLIRKQIIIEAQRLLHFTNYSINEIADKLGFENVSYFVTFFKKQIQKTPEQYRKEENH
jgi:AraC family transcriptional activator of pobA